MSFGGERCAATIARHETIRLDIVRTLVPKAPNAGLTFKNESASIQAVLVAG